MKVADFGLARAYADGKATQAGGVQGTVQYLAPEQIRGEPADPRSDLYSLGIVTYELLTGRLPFTGETAMDRVQALSDACRSRRPPSGTSRGARRLVLSATDATASSGRRAQRRCDVTSSGSRRPAARSLARRPFGDLPEVSGDGAVTERMLLVASTSPDDPSCRADEAPWIPAVPGVLFLMVALAAAAVFRVDIRDPASRGRARGWPERRSTREARA